MTDTAPASPASPASPSPTCADPFEVPVTDEDVAAVAPYRRVRIDGDACIAPSASIVGDAEIGPDVTVLFHASIRGDYESHIVIGAGSNVQEGCSLHVDKGSSLVVGRRVIIGHNATVHGCTVRDGALIGMGATIMNDAVIGEDAVIGAGALVTERKQVPPRAVMVGVPAKCVRTLTDAEVEKNRTDGRYYIALGRALVRDGVLYKGSDLPHDLPEITLAE